MRRVLSDVVRKGGTLEVDFLASERVAGTGECVAVGLEVGLDAKGVEALIGDPESGEEAAVPLQNLLPELGIHSELFSGGIRLHPNFDVVVGLSVRAGT